MDNPKLYNKSNLLQRQITVDLLDRFWEHIKWNQNENDEVIDIGCGSGNVTCEVLYPLLPSSIKNLIGVDINEKMVKTASKNYSDNPKTTFKVLDICKAIPINFEDAFHHAFSFFCLNWVRDQRLAMKNLFSLLKPGGDTFILLVGSCDQVFCSYIEMEKDMRWQKYMENIEDILPPYLDEKEPEEYLRKNMEDVGFHVKVSENISTETIFENDQSLKDFLEAINPFVKRMPENEKEEYLRVYVEKVKLRDPKKSNDVTTRVYVEMLAAYAYKPL